MADAEVTSPRSPDSVELKILKQKLSSLQSLLTAKDEKIKQLEDLVEELKKASAPRSPSAINSSSFLEPLSGNGTSSTKHSFLSGVSSQTGVMLTLQEKVNQRKD